MSTLYELVGQRLTLQHKLEELNFDEETILDTLEGESTEIAAKIEDYVYVIRNRTALTDAMAVEIDRMMARREAELNRIEAIEKWLLDSMIACDFKKVECPAFSIAVQANPPKVEVLDETQIPNNYWSLPEPKPPVAVLDKREILAALKSGIDVEGCKLTNSYRLVVK